MSNKSLPWKSLKSVQRVYTKEVLQECWRFLVCYLTSRLSHFFLWYSLEQRPKKNSPALLQRGSFQSLL